MPSTTFNLLTLASLLLSTSVIAAPQDVRRQAATDLRDHIHALDRAGKLQWEEVEGGRIAAITGPAVDSRSDPNGVNQFLNFPNPVDWLGSQFYDSVSGDVNVDNINGRYMCPGGGSRMLESLIDPLAASACTQFVQKSAVGQLSTKVWYAYDSYNVHTTTTDGYIRWLLGSVSDNPVKLTQKFCTDMWSAVKSLCQVDQTTQGQAISVGDWTLYADPNDKNNN